MTNKTIAALVKCSTYDPSEVYGALAHSIELIGGIGTFVRPGENILIKINLLGAYPPEKRVTTHPEIVRAVIDLVKEAGATPIVGDSPGGINNLQSYKKALAVSGIGPVCEATATEFVCFDGDIATLSSPDGKLYKRFKASGLIHEVDGVIALPVLKTHGLMRITCAVKVLYGFISGIEKLQYHLKVPTRPDFADMLVDLYLAVKPRLALVDAVVGMDGAGPSHGSPIQIGAVIASPDCLAADVAACRLIGVDPLAVYTTASAASRGLIDIGDVQLTGDPLEELAITGFRLPEGDLTDRAPALVRRLLKNLVTARPYVEHADACSACTNCRNICPVNAVSLADGKPEFDYDKCIRCYCCEELCPEGVIGRKNHRLIKPFAGLLS